MAPIGPIEHNLNTKTNGDDVTGQYTEEDSLQVHVLVVKELVHK